MIYKTYKEVDEAFQKKFISKSQKIHYKRRLRATKRRLRYVHDKALKRATKLSRFPKWANVDKIKRIYKECPKGLTVDHIIPLNAKLVCGLHTENNLQYLTNYDNSKKSNKFTPLHIIANELE